MKICYLGNHNDLHIKPFVEYFLKKDYEIHIFCRNNPYSNKSIIFHDLKVIKMKSVTNSKYGNIKMSPFDFSNVSENYFSKIISREIFLKGVDFYDFLRIPIRINKIRPDIIHGHEALGWGVKTALAGNYPKILTCWGSDIFRYPWQSKGNFLKVNFALKNVDLIHVKLEYTKDFIINNFNIDEAKIIAISWDIDLGLFNQDNIKKEDIDFYKKRLGIKEQDIVLLYPKGFRESKRQNYLNLVKAFSDLSLKRKNVKLILLSNGEKDGFKELSQIIVRNNLSDKVITFNNMIPLKRMPLLYSISDFHVVIPDTDQFSFSILEGMLLGSIPILSDIDVYKSYLKSNKNCFYVDAKDPRSIEKILDHSIENIDEIKKKFITTNIKYVQENFDRNKQMPKFEKMYEKFL